MKQFLILILIITLPKIILSQEQDFSTFPDTWVLIDKYNKDGKSIKDEIYLDSDIATFTLDNDWNFSNKKELIKIFADGFPEEKTYVVDKENGTITVGNNVLQINKIENDTLYYIAYNLKNKKNRDSVICIRKNAMLLDFINSNKNTDTAILNYYAFPGLKDSVWKYIRYSSHEFSDKGMNFEGVIYINTTNDSLSIIPKEHSSISDIDFQMLKKVFETYNPFIKNEKLYSKYKYLGIPLYAMILDKNQKFGLGYKLSISLFYPANYNAMSQSMKISKKNFKEGLKQYEEGDTANALKSFFKAYQLDIYGKNAKDCLLNLSAIYYQKGNKQEACRFWKIMDETGYQEGIERYNYYCK